MVIQIAGSAKIGWAGAGHVSLEHPVGGAVAEMMDSHVSAVIVRLEIAF